MGWRLQLEPACTPAITAFSTAALSASWLAAGSHVGRLELRARSGRLAWARQVTNTSLTALALAEEAGLLGAATEAGNLLLLEIEVRPIQPSLRFVTGLVSLKPYEPEALICRNNEIR